MSDTPRLTSCDSTLFEGDELAVPSTSRLPNLEFALLIMDTLKKKLPPPSNLRVSTFTSCQSENSEVLADFLFEDPKKSGSSNHNLNTLLPTMSLDTFDSDLAINLNWDQDTLNLTWALEQFEALVSSNSLATSASSSVYHNSVFFSPVPTSTGTNELPKFALSPAPASSIMNPLLLSPLPGSDTLSSAAGIRSPVQPSYASISEKPLFLAPPGMQPWLSPSPQPSRMLLDTGSLDTFLSNASFNPHMPHDFSHDQQFNYQQQQMQYPGPSSSAPSFNFIPPTPINPLPPTLPHPQNMFSQQLQLPPFSQQQQQQQQQQQHLQNFNQPFLDSQPSLQLHQPQRRSSTPGTPGSSTSTSILHKTANNQINDTRSRDFQCSICLNKFLRKQDLKRHEATHGGKEFVCPIGCGAAFARNDALGRHVKTGRCARKLGK
ncbi:hypothetical protein BCR33DRAFT_711394 [Rhizoclosmatium globosum]|uniref:C2H2-type domain-containing protein n=1 Tax=Rhizoclosmatium globosum TaxID=329046 RepID=A0A1Y2D1K4_9FUNG|nr:hypothetical protein BCR33DRAFT_711394 [Rhizoclosmatium globosum]|eukprot:ORY52996.1 hypothetical protein BCR33DRAFT_711394 [Rhizoclosmatium globosum]